jgi:hypothetical protein
MDRSRPERRLGRRSLRPRLGEPVNTATGPGRPAKTALARPPRSRGQYDLAGPRSRLAMRKRVAAEDVEEIQGDDRFFAPDAPGRDEDDL